MKYILILLLLLPVLTFGQDSVSYAPTRPIAPVVAPTGPVLKLAPLSLVDVDPTVQGAVEIPLRPKWSVQQEIGYGGPSFDPLQRREWNWFYRLGPSSTFRSRTEIRYYFSPDLLQKGSVKAGPNGFYIAGEALLKQLNHKRPGQTLQSTPFVGLPSPPVVVPATARVTRNVYGFHAKIGYQANLGKPGKQPQFIVDVYVGVGFRVISVRQTGGPDLRASDWEELKNTRYLPFEGTLRKPSLAGGVKIGWLITTEKKVKKK